MRQQIQHLLLGDGVQLLLPRLVVVGVQQLLAVLADEPHAHLRQRDLREVLLQEEEQLVDLRERRGESAPCSWRAPPPRCQ